MKYDFSLIHKFCIDNVYVVLDINSGLVHSVSKTVWDFLVCLEQLNGDVTATQKALLSKYPLAELNQVWKELDSIIKGGMLFSSGKELEGYNPERTSVVKALCLHVAHDCNLRCRYCFAGTGDFGGERGLMSLETGKKALDFLFAASGPRKHVEVDYFGGEPLLNFAVVKELIEYGQEGARRHGKVLKQTLTTNGVLLNQETVDYLNKEGISLVLSLDGRKEVHDRMRPYGDGSGSYDEILPRLKRVVQSRGQDNYFLRGTYTRYNLDFSRDVLHMVEEGFRLVSVEPVVAEPEQDYAIRLQDVGVLEEEYEKLARAWLKHRRAGDPFEFFHFNISLDRGPCLPKRLSGCGAGHEYLAVSPEGGLYPCHQFVGKREFKVGHVDTGIVNPSLGEQFRAAHVLNKEVCRSCWARFYCSGGCHANAFNYNGDITIPYEVGCCLEKKRLECAIYLQVMGCEDLAGASD